MPTVIIRPTKAYVSSTSAVADVSNAYDNDTSTRAAFNYSSGRAVFYGFDMSAIPKNTKIKNIKAVITCYGLGSDSADCCAVRAVYGATSATTSAMTDCGDGYIDCYASNNMTSSSAVTRQLSFPTAATYWTNNLNAFLSGGFQLHFNNTLHSKSYFYLKEVYVEIEYAISVTVSTSSSPEEGGSVSGGGTYETGSTVTLKATANKGYQFSYWLINGVNSGNTNPLTAQVDTDYTVVAVFEKVETSKVYCGTKKVSVYCGTKKVSVYCGTVKIL